MNDLDKELVSQVAQVMNYFDQYVIDKVAHVMINSDKNELVR